MIRDQTVNRGSAHVALHRTGPRSTAAGDEVVASSKTQLINFDELG